MAVRKTHSTTTCYNEVTYEEALHLSEEIFNLNKKMSTLLDSCPLFTREYAELCGILLNISSFLDYLTFKIHKYEKNS